MVDPAGTVGESKDDARCLREAPIDALLELTTRLGIGAEADFDRALSLATALLGMSYGIVSRIEGQTYRIDYLCQPDGAGLSVGQMFELGDTYCSITACSREVISIGQVGVSEFAGHPCYRSMGLESYIAAPLRIDGEVYGTLNFSSPYARRRDWSEVERLLVRLLANWVESAIRQRMLNERLSAALRDLDRANAELVERNRDLDQFAHFASHDLQAPLRHLVAFTELLERDVGPGLSERAATDLRLIQSSASRMLSLVRDLLELSRVGRVSLRVEDVDLGECVAEVIPALQETIGATGAEIEYGELPIVRADRACLVQVLQNLVDNALKFQSPGARPRVAVSAQVRTGVARVAVRDNGIGIAPEHMATVFSPFERIYSADEYPGSGLGLAVCRKLVELHGGELTVDSRVGQGSTFAFTLRN